jgi:hypothetical protein
MLRGALWIAACALATFGLWSPAGRVRAQTASPPAALASATPSAPGASATIPGGGGTPATLSTLTPSNPGATPSQAPGAAASGTPQPAVSATQPPIIVDPPDAGIMLGGSETLHLIQVLGEVTATVDNPAIVDASVDQDQRTLTLTGKAVGTANVTVRDARGLERVVPVRVAYAAGTIAPQASIRVTGRPATAIFLREQALSAAIAVATVRPGAQVIGSADGVVVNAPLKVDDVTTIDVPLIVQGDGLISVLGTTHVRVENFAQPSVRPASLLVSDYPETLRENGILFSADITAKQAERFLYFHYNPADQPDRRIVLKVQNTSGQPALVQFIEGVAGPDVNEMQVGHLSTQRFLVRLAQNEGSVVTIPGNSTVSLLAQYLPAKSIVSGLLQLHEIEGVPLHLTLVAQNAGDPSDGPIPTSALLAGGQPHARGIYPIPEFYFDYSYDCDDGDLEIPIGQIPLPNLVQGQRLAGDYGVLQSVTIRMINNDRHNARQIALYADPRGGRATGTFVIDRVLVQAHAIPPFERVILRQYTLPPNSFVRTEIVTMPEGGSSYPLRLVVAPDDGTAPPSSPDSPVY